MFKQISYKKKNKMLIAVLIIGGLLIYSFAIKKTIALVNEVQANSDKINSAKNAPARSQALKKEIEKIDTKIGAFNKVQENEQQSLLELITDYSHTKGTVLREFPEVTRENNGSFIVETNRFVVEGNFQSLLDLVYLLEQNKVPGKIASVDYVLKKDLKTKEMALTATIYLQNIKKK
jgi:hypothetical protein